MNLAKRRKKVEEEKKIADFETKQTKATRDVKFIAVAYDASHDPFGPE